MKTKEEIENLKDIRRNLWISVIGIIGGLSISLLKVTVLNFTWVFVFKIILITTGTLVSGFFISEIIWCNKRILSLINNLKEE